MRTITVEGYGFHIASADPTDNLVDKNKVVSRRKTLEVEVDYPLGATFLFKIKMRGGQRVWKLKTLIKRIQEIYNMIYKDQNKYNVWGHELGDLHLEEIEIRNGRVTLGVGS